MAFITPGGFSGLILEKFFILTKEEGWTTKLLLNQLGEAQNLMQRYQGEWDLGAFILCFVFHYGCIIVWFSGLLHLLKGFVYTVVIWYSTWLRSFLRMPPHTNIYTRMHSHSLLAHSWWEHSLHLLTFFLVFKVILVYKSSSLDILGCREIQGTSWLLDYLWFFLYPSLVTQEDLSHPLPVWGWGASLIITFSLPYQLQLYMMAFHYGNKSN